VPDLGSTFVCFSISQGKKERRKIKGRRRRAGREYEHVNG
jgi:hypothetical protein